jgi:hypothetical protein
MNTNPMRIKVSRHFIENLMRVGERPRKQG